MFYQFTVTTDKIPYAFFFINGIDFLVIVFRISFFLPDIFLISLWIFAMHERSIQLQTKLQKETNTSKLSQQANFSIFRESILLFRISIGKFYWMQSLQVQFSSNHETIRKCGICPVKVSVYNWYSNRIRNNFQTKTKVYIGRNLLKNNS